MRPALRTGGILLTVVGPVYLNATTSSELSRERAFNAASIAERRADGKSAAKFDKKVKEAKYFRKQR